MFLLGKDKITELSGESNELQNCTQKDECNTDNPDDTNKQLKSPV